MLDHVAQVVANLIADSGVMNLIPAWPHTLVDIDLEIFSTVFHLLPLIQGKVSLDVHLVLVNCLI